MTQIAAMRALKITTACALLGGAAIVLITLATRPTWNPLQIASNMSVILGMPVDPDELIPPTNVANYASLGTGLALVAFGPASLLTTLHAAAVRQLWTAPAERKANLAAQAAEER